MIPDTEKLAEKIRRIENTSRDGIITINAENSRLGESELSEIETLASDLKEEFHDNYQFCYNCGKLTEYVHLLIRLKDICLCDECIEKLHEIKVAEE